MILSLSYEAELIERCLKNDILAQKQMYEWLSPRMFAVCLRYAGDREDARDILHDGFITLFEKLGGYKGEGSFEGWARRIFVNTALMSMRKGDVLKYSEGLEGGEAIKVTVNPTAIGQLEAETLMKLISQMPAGFRTVFNMYAIEGYSHQEIAKALDITEGGSRSQLSRARLWLQEKLQAMGVK